MDAYPLIPVIRGLGLVLAMSVVVAEPARAQATANVTCSARIRPQAAADYDLSTEVTLRGQVVGREGAMILLKIAAGTVRIDAGVSAAVAAIPVGSVIEVVAAKRQENGRQRLLAREIRHWSGALVLRDRDGVPIQAIAQL